MPSSAGLHALYEQLFERIVRECGTVAIRVDRGERACIDVRCDVHDGEPAPGCGLCLSRAAIMTSLAGDDESAFELFENLLEVSPTFAAYALLHMGRIRLEAASLAEDAGLQAEAHAYLDRAEGILLQAIDSGNERFLVRWFLADVHAVRGEIDQSLDWLDRAVEGGHHEFTWDLIEPALQNVRSHPRFTAQVEHMRQHVRDMRDRARSEGWHTAEPPAFP